MINDNLGSLFEGDPSAPKPMSLRQGVVEEWDPDTGENSIQIAGALLVNIPALTGEAVALAAGDVVAMLTTGDTWLVIGRVTTPGDPGTVPSWVGDLTALAPLVPLAGVTDGLTITGAVNETDAPGTGPRVVINDPAYPGEIVLYTDGPGEIEPARIKPIVSGSVVSYLQFIAPKTAAGPGIPASLYLSGNGATRSVEMNADIVRVSAAADVIVEGDTTTIQSFNGNSLVLDWDAGALEATADLTADRVTVTAPATEVSGTLDVTGALTKGTVPVVTTTGSQTLTNKDLTASTNTFPGQMLTQVLTATCSTNVDVTTTEVDITGATVTFSTTKTNAKYLVTGSFYFAAILANTGVASGKLSVDGSVQTPFANFTGTNATFDRTNSSQTWSGTLASTGSHTLKLRGVGSAAAPNPAQRINSGSTTITVLVFE